MVTWGTDAILEFAAQTSGWVEEQRMDFMLKCEAEARKRCEEENDTRHVVVYRRDVIEAVA